MRYRNGTYYAHQRSVFPRKPDIATYQDYHAVYPRPDNSAWDSVHVADSNFIGQRISGDSQTILAFEFEG